MIEIEQRTLRNQLAQIGHRLADARENLEISQRDLDTARLNMYGEEDEGEQRIHDLESDINAIEEEIRDMEYEQADLERELSEGEL